MPAQPSRRPGPARRGSRPVRKKGTPPIVLAAVILVPLLGIAVALQFNRMRQRQETGKAELVRDPNTEIAALEREFQELQEKTRGALRMDRESTGFRAQVENLKNRWTGWMERFDAVFADVRNPDGTWPAEYQEYSKLKSRAGLMRLDLIKTGNL